MVMKRYPNGAEGDFFYMKRAPEPRPDWIEICEISHTAGMVNFPIVQDLPSLLWLINLGCIDLNPWYARCDDTDRPDFLHFDLDPGPGADFGRVREVALRVRDILDKLKMPTYPKTSSPVSPSSAVSGFPCRRNTAGSRPAANPTTWAWWLRPRSSRAAPSASAVRW